MYLKILKLLFRAFLLLIPFISYTQIYEYKNGYWLINGSFKQKKLYSINGIFSFKKPNRIDSIIDLKNGFCIPPFGDAHTHNLDGSWRLKEMVQEYLKEGVFYVQILGNHGSNTENTRKILQQMNTLEATYANGILTSTYGHGFYPYEPMAMGIYAPILQIKYADSIKKSRIVENNAYYFLDSKEDVDKKWSLIAKYKPDHIKICLIDAENYVTKRKLEKVDDNGLSPEVAQYVVKKAHNEGLRVFAHVETANDAKLCAKIGVDVLAHMPGYSWNGKPETKEKYCLKTQDIKFLKQKKIEIIPTFNLDYTSDYDENGTETKHSNESEIMFQYKKELLQNLYKEGVNIALGTDLYGRTLKPEIESLIQNKVFTNQQLINILCTKTPQNIFPKRKIGLIQEGYESSFLLLSNNPYIDINAIKNIQLKVKNGRIIQ
ncbi:MAG: hypothetical protein MUC49_18540 [Raineya sp.]|nr:hypothetical protein [Raineya sp.]